MNLSSKILGAAVLSLALSGCATWDNLSEREKGAVVGAGVGGVIGGATTDSAVGTLGGAAVGGVVGHEIGKRQEKR